MNLIFLNHWRAIVTCTNKGILVLDVCADSEAESKGRADTAATTHLGAQGIQNVIVMKHTDMPIEWLNRQVNHKETKQ